MTTLHEAAQQALEDICGAKLCEINSMSSRHEMVRLMDNAIIALRTALAQPETCTWHQDGDSDSGVYATSCRHYFNLEDGTPEDNKMAHCCYCGKKLVQELITEDDDE